MFNLNIYHDLRKVFFSAKVLFKYLIIERVVSFECLYVMINND